jgi:hypothetical protein
MALITFMAVLMLMRANAKRPKGEIGGGGGGGQEVDAAELMARFYLTRKNCKSIIIGNERSGIHLRIALPKSGYAAFSNARKRREKRQTCLVQRSSQDVSNGRRNIGTFKYLYQTNNANSAVQFGLGLSLDLIGSDLVNGFYYANTRICRRFLNNRENASIATTSLLHTSRIFKHYVYIHNT